MKSKAVYEVGCIFWFNSQTHCNHSVEEETQNLVCKSVDKWLDCKYLKDEKN